MMFEDTFASGFLVGAAATMAVTVVGVLAFGVIRPWVRMKLTGGRGSLIQILAMRFRGTPPMMIVEVYTSLLHSGINVRLMEVESQYVANRSDIMDVQDLSKHVREYCRRRDQAKNNS